MSKKPSMDSGTRQAIELRALEDVALHLGLTHSRTAQLVHSHRVPVLRDYRGRPAIAAEQVHTLAEDRDYVAFRNEAIIGHEYGRHSNSEAQDQYFREKRLQLLQSYLQHTEELEEIHRRSRISAHRHGFESVPMAQYLLLGRAIASIRALHCGLQFGHWTAMALVRNIDECNDLAHYFVATGETDSGRRACRRWFREGHWPSHSVCRQAIARFQSSRMDDVIEHAQLELLKELYRKKSKFTHPSFAVIRDVTRLDVENGDLVVRAISYGADGDEQRLWEAADFLRASSIQPTAQMLAICLFSSIGCSSEDGDRLLALNRAFEEWERPA